MPTSDADELEARGALGILRMRLGRGRAFNLSRWFAVVGLLSIACISALAGYLLSAFVTERMLRQEGELTMEFVQSLVLVETSFLTYFSAPGGGGRQLQTFLHLAQMPDVLRANIYNRDRTIIWSSDPQLVGQRFAANDELDRALSGRLVVESEAHGIDAKAEHKDLTPAANLFVEIYLPVLDAGGEEVVGAIELYKNPVALFNALQQLRSYIALGAAFAGIFLYLALFWLVRRADLVIREQQRRLIQSETLAVVGEMGSAVAHGIRNPLASIRSSAELVLVNDPDIAREAATDIIAESDRLDAWVRALLSYSRPLDQKSDAVELRPILEQSLEEYERELERRKISLNFERVEALPPVRGNALLLGQVIHNLFANAIEAMGQDGRLDVVCRYEGGRTPVMLTIRDSGPGMTPEQLRRVGKPFYTTKAQGLGVGLALARRIVERFGGRLEIESTLGEGTLVRLTLPTA